MSGNGVLSDVDKAFSSISNSVGDAFQKVGSTIERYGTAIIRNPLPVIEAAAITYVTGGIGSAAAGAILGTAAQGTFAYAAISAATSASLAAASTTALNGGSVSDIASAGIISGLTAGLSAGLNASQVLQFADNSTLFGQIINSATGRAVGGAISAVISGKDPLTGAVNGAVSGAVTGAFTSDQLLNLGSAAANVFGTSVGAGVAAAIAGKDVAAAFTNSLLGGAVRAGLNYATNELKTFTSSSLRELNVWGHVNQMSQQVKDILQEKPLDQNDLMYRIQTLNEHAGSAAKAYTEAEARLDPFIQDIKDDQKAYLTCSKILEELSDPNNDSGVSKTGEDIANYYRQWRDSNIDWTNARYDAATNTVTPVIEPTQEEKDKPLG